MEFSKKEIHTSVLTQSKYSQITVDDDFTIPDSKGDMEKIVAKEGHILLESMIPEDGKVRITGSVLVFGSPSGGQRMSLSEAGG